MSDLRPAYDLHIWTVFVTGEALKFFANANAEQCLAALDAYWVKMSSSEFAATNCKKPDKCVTVIKSFGACIR